VAGVYPPSPMNKILKKLAFGFKDAAAPGDDSDDGLTPLMETSSYQTDGNRLAAADPYYTFASIAEAFGFLGVGSAPVLSHRHKAMELTSLSDHLNPVHILSLKGQKTEMHIVIK